MRAFTLMLVLALSVSAHAQSFVDGMNAFKRGDFDAALTIWRPLAERGLADAQNNLGFMYGNGNGVPQDFAEAAKWYRKAAEQGYAMAQYNLGEIYARAKGVPQDLLEAARWYRMAAEKGNPRAQLKLGALYADGKGVPQDSAEAVKWIQKAAVGGDKEVTEAAERGLQLLGVSSATTDEVATAPAPQNSELTSPAHSKQAERVWTCTGAGSRSCRMVDKSPSETPPAELCGNSTTGFSCYKQGMDAYNRNDYATAVSVMRELANRDVMVRWNAMYNLGIFYSEGAGVPRDLTEAAMWLRKSTEVPVGIMRDADRQQLLVDANAKLQSIERGEAEHPNLDPARAAIAGGIEAASQHLMKGVGADPNSTEAAEMLDLLMGAGSPKAEEELRAAYAKGMVGGIGMDPNSPLGKRAAENIADEMRNQASCPSGYVYDKGYCVAQCPSGYRRSGGYCVK